MVFRKYVKKRIPIMAERLERAMEVETLEGTFHGKRGDYLVIGVKGEKYVVDGKIFRETYERVG